MEPEVTDCRNWGTGRWCLQRLATIEQIYQHCVNKEYRIHYGHTYPYFSICPDSARAVIAKNKNDLHGNNDSGAILNTDYYHCWRSCCCWWIVLSCWGTGSYSQTTSLGSSACLLLLDLGHYLQGLGADQSLTFHASPLVVAEDSFQPWKSKSRIPDPLDRQQAWKLSFSAE